MLVRQAAEALKRVQADLNTKGLSLRVYDCYRPARSVAAFVAWAKRQDDARAKAHYYPRLDKTALFPDYIATRSGHSRGATIDATLVMLNTPVEGIESEMQAPCTAPQPGHAADGSLSMGTSFDCFDVKANTAASGLSKEENDNRAALTGAMRSHGFQNYPLEWWHYTLCA